MTAHGDTERPFRVGYGPTRDARPASSCVQDIGQGSARSSLSKLVPPRHSDDRSYQGADMFKVHSEEAGWPFRLLGWLRLICSEASRV
jgi:hypothetical protein